MAGILITESVGAGKYGMPIMGPSFSTQSVSYTTSTQSSAFASDTNIVRIIADADVYLEFGSNPTALVTSIRVPANTVEYFAVNPGYKVAAYDGSS
jgi:hypothetical protein